MSLVTLITPTSDRPAAFELCERWMARQTYKGPLEWIVADDGKGAVVCSRGQKHLRGMPSKDADTSFCNNLRAAFEAATGDIILVIEDDDWYHPDYVLRMAEWLSGNLDIVGEGRARYYNVATRRYRLFQNNRHACLCQTGFKKTVLPWVIEQLKMHPRNHFLDMRIWKESPAEFTRFVWPESRHAVGIKGIVGKSGLGVGHRLKETALHDQNGTVLRSWIGNDASVYDHFCRQSQEAQQQVG